MGCANGQGEVGWCAISERRMVLVATAFKIQRGGWPWACVAGVAPVYRPHGGPYRNLSLLMVLVLRRSRCHRGKKTEGAGLGSAAQCSPPPLAFRERGWLWAYCLTCLAAAFRIAAAAAANCRSRRALA